MPDTCPRRNKNIVRVMILCLKKRTKRVVAVDRKRKTNGLKIQSFSYLCIKGIHVELEVAGEGDKILPLHYNRRIFAVEPLRFNRRRKVVRQPLARPLDVRQSPRIDDSALRLPPVAEAEARSPELVHVLLGEAVEIDGFEEVVEDQAGIVPLHEEDKVDGDGEADGVDLGKGED